MVVISHFVLCKESINDILNFQEEIDKNNLFTLKERCHFLMLTRKQDDICYNGENLSEFQS